MSLKEQEIYEENMAEYEAFHNRPPATFGEASKAFFDACNNMTRMLANPMEFYEHGKKLSRVDDNKIPF